MPFLTVKSAFFPTAMKLNGTKFCWESFFFSKERDFPNIRYKNLQYSLRHFRIFLCLFFKTSLSAKPFIQWVSFSCKSKSLKLITLFFFYLPRQNAVDIQKLISRLISGYIYTDDVTSGTKSITTQDEYKTHRSERLGKSRWRLPLLDTFFPPFPPASLPSPYGLRPSIAFEVNVFTHLCQIAVWFNILLVLWLLPRFSMLAQIDKIYQDCSEKAISGETGSR